MAEITIRKNGQVILDKNTDELHREYLANLMKTQNPGAKTIQTSLESLGGKAYAESFGKAGKPSDVFEVYEKDTLIAKGIRQNIAEKIRVALNRDAWHVEVFTTKSEPTSKVPQTFEAV